MMNKLLSIIIITYNQEKYIAQTLDSIIGQEHDYIYEVIIGEDCSTDETRIILLKYKEKYPSIIKLLLNNENMGMIKNYFNVINNCSGKYIMQCAGDDYWLPGKVASQIQYMENHSEAGMCYSKYKIINGKNKFFGVFPKKMNIEDVTFEKLMFANPIGALTVCLRRDLVLKYIEDIDPVGKDWIGEDMPMWRWFAYNSKIYPLDKVVAVYRQLERSISHPKKFEEMERIINYRYDLRMFYSKLYNMDYLDDKIEQTRINDFVLYATKYHEYNKYKIYSQKLPQFHIGTLIRKIAGINEILFMCYSHIFIFLSNRKQFFKLLLG